MKTMSLKICISKCIVLFVFILGAVFRVSSQIQLNPKLYITKEDVVRAKEQQDNPVIKPSLEKLKNEVDKKLAEWKKIIPNSKRFYSMEEIFEYAKESRIRPDYIPLSVAMVYFPNESIAKVLREMILYEVGIHRNEGSWRELGIHEGERLYRFLFAYDLSGKNLLLEKENEAVKEEIHQSARFLEAWCLQSDLNKVFQGQTYCFNIKFFPLTMLGTVAMYYPDLEESEAWLAKAQEEIPLQFYMENYLDGAYGESSMNYWSCTAHALLQYIVASKNLGYKDYMKDLPMRRALNNFVYWRANLTGPDGRKSVFGDGKHENAGNDLLELAAILLDDPELLWIARNSIVQASGGTYNKPEELLKKDLNLITRKPDHLYNNYIWSGYGVYRSGWDNEDNYFMMKYGPTLAGRREIEPYPVIAGHSHQDCMEIELFYKGIPMLLDLGSVGQYRDYDTYGGYTKATIAHSTVGIGNEWGYKRTDGKFDEHRKKHGKEFRYEKEQMNISRDRTRMIAWGDVNTSVLLTAKAETYKNITHQRSTVWFRNNSLLIVHDRLEGDKDNYYEWYLNPIGNNLSTSDRYTFGDDKAKMDVIPLLVKETEIIRQGTPGIPNYYYCFRKNNNGKSDGGIQETVPVRWNNFSLMVETQKGKSAEFFNVIVPYKNNTPYVISDFAVNGKKLSSKNEQILVNTKSSNKELSVDGEFGVVRKEDNITDYVLSNGYELKENDMILLKSELYSTAWSELYDHSVSGIVSLEHKRASFTLKPNPWDQYMLMFNPKIEEGKEPAVPIQVKISFKVDEKPKKIVRLRSNEEQPELENKVFDDKIEKGNFFKGKKQYKIIESRIAREVINFEYNDINKLVSVILPNGFNQLVWE